MKQFFLIIATLVSSVHVHAQTDSISREQELKEVVVSATKPLSKFDSDGIITTVAGTPLQTLETANALLGYIPGVISQNGSIEVVGRGQPLIYINGRKLRNLSELEQLPASKVRDVKVINNPGARYGSDINAVIRISTVKDIGDGFSLDSRATAGVRHYFYNKEVLNMNYRAGGLDIFTDAEYNNSKNNGSLYNTQHYWGTQQRLSAINSAAVRRTQMMDGKIGLNYSTSTGQLFGAFYEHTYKPTKETAESSSSFINNGMSAAYSEVRSHENENDYSNLVDAYYSGAWNSWSVDATFDFLWRNNNTDQKINEAVTDLTVNDMSLRDRSKGRMFAGELHFSKKIGNGEMSFGTEYTNTSRTEDFLSDAPSIASLNNRISENNIGVYGLVSQTFGAVMLQAGLRYEHISTSYREDDIRKNEQSGSYNEILPSATLTLPVRNTMFQLGYSRKYTRPHYSQLSSTVNYVDQYTYQSGNPNLKNTFIDMLSLNFRYQWLMVMASYKNIRDRIITVCTQYPTDTDITLLRKENSRNDANDLEFIVSAAPGFIGNIYYPVAMAGVVSQFYDIDFKGGVKHMDKPMVLVRFNNILRLPANFMAYANLSYRSSCESENIYLGRTWQFDLSVAKTFNQHWETRLSFNDVFNTARKNRMTIYSGWYEFSNLRINTLRGVEISIGYKFNTSRSKYKGKGAGNNEKERL